MTSWPSKSTLQRLLDLAGLRYTTSEKFLGWTTAMLFWLVFHQTQSNLYKWFRMQRHDWSSMSPKEPMLHLSSSHCTGYQWQLASSSDTDALHTERPQLSTLLLPLTMTNFYIPPEVWDLLVSDACGTITERLKITLQNILIHHSWWWNNLPTPIRNVDPCQSFKQQLKTHLFRHYLTSS